MSMPKANDWLQQSDKEAKRLIKEAFHGGWKVPYTVSRLIELKTPVRVLRAVYAGKSA